MWLPVTEKEDPQVKLWDIPSGRKTISLPRFIGASPP